MENEQQKKILVITHAQCRDGMCAAWVALRKFGDSAEYYAAFFGQPPPPVAGREVYVIDFSYPRLVMDQMAAEASSLKVLDHHKTAEAAMAGAPYAEFDMERSGAGMAWDYFFPNQPRPWFVDYVEDRDLWRFKLANSHEVNAYLSTLPFEFSEWDALTDADDLEGYAVQMGRICLRKTEQYVAVVCTNARRVNFAGYQGVPVVNAPQIDVSEVGHHLCQDAPLAVAWWQRSDGKFQYSLRSRTGSPVDVSEIAKTFGGGGHQHAAGFELDHLLFAAPTG